MAVMGARICRGWIDSASKFIDCLAHFWYGCNVGFRRWSPHKIYCFCFGIGPFGIDSIHTYGKSISRPISESCGYLDQSY